jgi:hypothetical protein
MGLGIKHLHMLQEIAWIKDILNHTYSNTTTGQLFRTSLEYLLLELGMENDLSAVDYTKYHILATNCLLKSTWEFLSLHKIKLQHNIEVPKNTMNDRPLMLETRNTYFYIK